MYQFRTGKRIFDPNRELDADVWGLFLSLLAGYDPYAVAGTLAKMVMANGQADLQSQYTLEFSRISEHGSFNNRLDHIYDTIVDICKEQQVACNSYREFFHPHFPEGELLTRKVKIFGRAADP